MAEIIGYIGRAQTLTAELSTPQTLTASFGGGGTSHGIPSGGEPGQGLIKVSDTDYATRWMSILPEDTASGSVASFPDGSDDLPMGVVVDVDPVQDLHGYDNPWPEGGGKNLLAMSLDNIKEVNNAGVWNGNVYTLNSVNFTVQTDSGGNVTGIAATGTASARTLFLLWTDYAYLSDMGLTDRYTLSGCPSGGGNSTYTLTLQAEGSGNISDTGASVSFDASSLTSQKYRFVAEVRANATVSNLVFKPMLRLSSVTDATFAPYSNICPISGWDGAKVTRTGRNLLKVKYPGRTHNGVTYVTNEDGTITLTGTASGSSYFASNYGFYTDYMVLLPAGTYTMSGSPNTNIRVYGTKFALDGTNLGTISQDTGSGSTFTIVEPTWFNPQVYVASGASTNLTIRIQVQVGSKKTSYEPYTAVTHEIPFSTSVYGGKLNVETGECVVDRAMIDLGTLNWNAAADTGRASSSNRPDNIALGNRRNDTIINQALCNKYRLLAYYKTGASSDEAYAVDYSIAVIGSTSGTIFVKDPSIASFTAAQVKSAMTGVQFVYELATPITLTLDPVEIRSLLGDNNVWADTGDVSVIYKANIQGYINKKISAAVAAVS